VETGVASGMSSTFILKALSDNMKGFLYSIDLPPKIYYEDFDYVHLPEGKESGWAIPYELKEKWNLILGKSSDALPILLRKVGMIDIFLHDSEHSYSNMMTEYELVWAYLKEGSLLMADDVARNYAFYDFSLKVGRKPYYYLIGPRVLPSWDYQNPKKISVIGLLRKGSFRRKCR